MFKKYFSIFLVLALVIAGCNDDDHDGNEPEQDIPYPAEVQNKYPIILVHGVCGWGRDEMFGKFRYWGGTGDIQEYLKSKGYEVFTASVGPVSSNWDRAAELYYCIKGGKVDFGAVHSNRFGHERYGREYPGLYPEWDENHPVHIIGHSMGGPTPRYLIRFLEKGDEQEQAFIPKSNEAPVSDLFKGGKTGWVHSHTTISGAHNGTMIADDELKTVIKNMFYEFAALAGMTQHEWFYDFDMEYWGLIREDGETLDQYFNRVMDCPIWDSNDNCGYDVSMQASTMQNTYVPSSENVYYASYSFDCTEPGVANIRVPLATINPALNLTATRIGMNLLDLPMGYQAWRYNDGLLSVPCTDYPFGHKYVKMDPDNRKLAPKGTWDVHPVIEGQDHLSIIIPDQKNSIDDLNAFYEKVAHDLWCLPQ